MAKRYDYNCWSGLGRLAADPEIRHTQGGKQITEIRLAVQCGEEAGFFDLVAFDKDAEFLAGYFKKGQRVLVSNAALSQDNWQDKTTGEKRSKVKLKAVFGTKFHFVDPPKAQEAAESDGGY